MKRDLGSPAQASLLAQTVKRPLSLRRDDGSALVETAIILPLLLLLLTAAASYSWSLYNMQSLGSAVTGATQALASQAWSVSNPCSVVATQVTNSLPQWNASKLTYTVKFSNSAGATTPTAPFSWTGSTAPTACAAEGTGGSTPQQQDTPVSVTAQYTISGLQILNLLPGSKSNPVTNLSSSETMMAF